MVKLLMSRRRRNLMLLVGWWRRKLLCCRGDTVGSSNGEGKGEPAVVDGGAAVMRPDAFIEATVAGREPAVMLKVGAGEPVATT